MRTTKFQESDAKILREKFTNTTVLLDQISDKVGLLTHLGHSLTRQILHYFF